MLQSKHSKTKPATASQLKEYSNNIRRKAIQILNKEEYFGEIGVLTNMKRTCSIVTKETCLF